MRAGGIFAMLLVLVVATDISAEPSLKEILLTPGDLSDAHSRLEGGCELCHTEFTRAAQGKLCLDCHEEIALDLSTRKRFHGLMADESCKACHTEHQGVDARITVFDSDVFDHANTAFILEGKHATALCSECHSDEKRSSNQVEGHFRIEQHTCTDCHEDAHDTHLGDDCTNCHGTRNWSTGFDHSKTSFPLEARHDQVVCQGCHTDESWQAPSTCHDCHAPADVHRDVMGVECEACHSPKGWETVTFDHADTTYPLHGAHQALACGLCHYENHLVVMPEGPRAKVKPVCLDCHQEQDIHDGAYSGDCQDCHTEKVWSDASFDHNKHSTYGLKGRHREVVCVACHAPGVAIADEHPRAECADCHAGDDVHAEALGDACENCHTVNESWKANFFDHDFTLFPLTGLHRLMPCASCHIDDRYTNAETTCDGCHDSGEHHKGVFVEQCDGCHNTGAWEDWRFDHQTTQFALEGAHVDVVCSGCHEPSLRDPLHPEQTCFACHAEDDVHDLQFGRKCDGCHSQSTFKGAQKKAGRQF